jgi:hypothetical protein
VTITNRKAHLEIAATYSASKLCTDYFGVHPARLEDFSGLVKVMQSILSDFADVEAHTKARPAVQLEVESLLGDIIAAPAEIVPDRIKIKAENIVKRFGKKVSQ